MAAMIPASIRNRNAGAQYPGPSAKKFGGTTFETLRSKDGVHKIARFPTHIHGAAALFDLLMNGRRDGAYLYRNKTVEKAIKTWCGEHYLSTYLAVLQKRGGIPPSQVLDEPFLRDHARSIPLARAMAWQEAGQDYPLTEQEWVEAHAMAFAGGKIAPEFSPMNDVPSPKPETRRAETVKEVAKVGIPLVVGSGGVAATATPTAAPSVPLPPVPDVSNLSSWQSVINTGKGLATWGVEQWPWVAAAVAIYFGIAYGLPWLQEKRS
jgi:hypothetical protein